MKNLFFLLLFSLTALGAAAQKIAVSRNLITVNRQPYARIEPGGETVFGVSNMYYVSSLQMAVKVIEKALRDTYCMQNMEIESALKKIKTFFSYNGCKELVLTVKTERQPVILEQTLHRSYPSVASQKLNPLACPPAS